MSTKYTDVYFDDVKIGMRIPEVHFPLTSQKMVMFAGVNRDFSPIHTDSAYARQDGAKDMYANSMLIIALFERMLREWAGLAAKIKKIGPFRMKQFTCVGNEMIVCGTVCDKRIDENGNKLVELDVTVGTEDDGTNVVGKSMVVLKY